MFQDILRTSTLASNRLNKDKKAVNMRDLKDDGGLSGEHAVRSIADNQLMELQITHLQ